MLMQTPAEVAADAEGAPQGEQELASYRGGISDSLAEDDVPTELIESLMNPDTASTDEADADGETEESASSEPTSDKPTGDARMDRLESLVSQVGSAVIRMQQGASTAATTPDSPPVATPKEMVAEIVGELPTSEEEGSTFTAADGTALVETIFKVVEKKMGSELAPVKEQLDRHDGSLTQSESQRVVDTYTAAVDKLLDDAEITSAFDRRAMRSLVTEQGARQFGQNFDMSKVSQVFQTVLEERLSSEVDTRNATADKKKERADKTPPVQNGAKTPNVAQESFRGRLADPNDRAADFQGGDFNKLVKAVLNR